MINLAIDLDVALFTLFLILVICVIGIIRNKMILKYRLNLVESDFDLFLTLPECEVMTDDFLTWNFDKYLFSVIDKRSDK